MALPFPMLSIAATGGGYLWQLSVKEASMELDRSNATGAEVTTLEDWTAFEKAVANTKDSDPYFLVDQTLAKVFDGYAVPEEVVNRFSTTLFEWILDNRAALNR